MYVDHARGALSEAGDLLQPVQEGAFKLEDVAGEVGEVVPGSRRGAQGR